MTLYPAKFISYSIILKMQQIIIINNGNIFIDCDKVRPNQDIDDCNEGYIKLETLITQLCQDLDAFHQRNDPFPVLTQLYN